MSTKLSDRFPGGMANSRHRASLRHLYAIELHRPGGEDGASHLQGEELGESNGFLGEAPRYTPADSWSLHVYQRPTFRGTTLPSHGGLDLEDTISSAQGFRDLRVPNINDPAHRPSRVPNYSRADNHYSRSAGSLRQ